MQIANGIQVNSVACNTKNHEFGAITWAGRCAGNGLGRQMVSVK